MDFLNIYHRSPYPIRAAIASARGYYLKRWRYGKDTERLVEEALEREHWSEENWKQWREERLAFVLRHAATKVPYYRAYWNELRRRGDTRSSEVLEHWPILKKQTLRDHAAAFIADDCNPEKMFADRTSGTTGTPLTIYLQRETVRAWYALYEARIRRWHDVSISQRWAIMGGQMVVPFEQKAPPFWVYNVGLNQLYLSTHHLSTANTRAYVDAIEKYKPTHMVVYPSSATVLASNMIEQGLTVQSVRAIFSNAEFLSEHARATMSKAFGCPVRNTYGMGELVGNASECEHGSMHAWPEVGLMEILDDEEDVAVPVGNIGRIVGTGIFNMGMPLIRYEVGDRGSVMHEDDQCACSRNLPMIKSIEGRMNDLVMTPDGRQVFWLNPVFYGLPVKESQIIQEQLEQFRVLIVPSNSFTRETTETITQRLRERVGDVEVTMEEVERIPRSKNGKLRAVICNLSKEEKERLLVS